MAMTHMALWIRWAKKWWKKGNNFKMGNQIYFRLGWSWHAEHVCCLNLTSISYSFLNKGQKVLTFWKFEEKKGNNSKLGTQINFKITG